MLPKSHDASVVSIALCRLGGAGEDIRRIAGVLHGPRLLLDESIVGNDAENASAHSSRSADFPVSFIFYSARNARIASVVLATAIPSVCLSVRHTPVLCQNDGT